MVVTGYATAASGGVRVYGATANSSGAGVVASGSGTNGTALRIQNGAIQTRQEKQKQLNPVVFHGGSVAQSTLGHK